MSASAADNHNGRWVCIASGKRRYRKRKQAMTGASMVAVQLKVRLSIYKCPACNDWHLTEVIDG